MYFTFCFSYNMYIIENKETKLNYEKHKNYCYCYDENKDPTRMIVEKDVSQLFYLCTK